MNLVCPQCGEIVHLHRGDSRKKFCSRSCAAIFNNKARAKPTVDRFCINCAEQIPFKTREFCSSDCRIAWRITEWLAGRLDGSWKYTHADYVKAYLDQISGRSCMLCGESRLREDGGSILQVDHIDGNWRNNRPHNLRLICPTCHALTDNYGARNMGHGRTWKAEYKQHEAKVPRTTI